MRNKDIKQYAKASGVFLWQVADEMHIQDSALSRKLRRELSAADKNSIIGIIDRIAARSAEGEL